MARYYSPADLPACIHCGVNQAQTDEDYCSERCWSRDCAGYPRATKPGCPDCERERVHSAGGNHFCSVNCAIQGVR